MAKLSLEINGDSEELKRVYAEIGRLYYDQAKDAPEGFFAPLFEQTAALIESINSKQAQIQARLRSPSRKTTTRKNKR